MCWLYITQYESIWCIFLNMLHHITSMLYTRVITSIYIRQIYRQRNTQTTYFINELVIYRKETFNRKVCRIFDVTREILNWWNQVNGIWEVGVGPTGSFNRAIRLTSHLAREKRVLVAFINIYLVLHNHKSNGVSCPFHKWRHWNPPGAKTPEDEEFLPGLRSNATRISGPRNRLSNPRVVVPTSHAFLAKRPSLAH